MFSSALIRSLKSEASIASLVLRIPVGIIFIIYGGQKLFGIWGGYGIAGTAERFSALGLEPSILMASLAGGAEFFGGIMLVLGLFVRPAGLALAFTMLVAILTVHIDRGMFVRQGGYEYALALMTICISLVVSGAGRLGLDNLLVKKF